MFVPTICHNGHLPHLSPLLLLCLCLRVCAATPGVMPAMPVPGGANPQLLPTIQVPRDIRLLPHRLPKPDYGDDEGGPAPGPKQQQLQVAAAAGPSAAAGVPAGVPLMAAARGHNIPRPAAYPGAAPAAGVHRPSSAARAGVPAAAAAAGGGARVPSASPRPQVSPRGVAPGGVGAAAAAAAAAGGRSPTPPYAYGAPSAAAAAAARVRGAGGLVGAGGGLNRPPAGALQGGPGAAAGIAKAAAAAGKLGFRSVVHGRRLLSDSGCQRAAFAPGALGLLCSFLCLASCRMAVCIYARQAAAAIDSSSRIMQPGEPACFSDSSTLSLS